MAAILLSLGGAGCTTVHDTFNKMKSVVTNGKGDHTPGEADEGEIGKSVGLLITNTYSPSDDQKLIEYVNLVGFTLISASNRPDGQYVFSILDTDDIGAFSGPDGSIFVTRGAVQAMRDEAELAGVLAHELAHIAGHHALKSAIAAAQKSGYMNAKGAMAGSDANRFIDGCVDVIVRNGYDKSQEAEADKAAVQLLVAAGYDPRSYAAYLSRLAAMQGTAAAHSRQIMTTHPDLANQASAITDQVRATAAPAGATMQERFAASIRH